LPEDKVRAATRYLIIGVDPGITIGLAIISLHGELIEVLSIKNTRLSEMVKIIYGFGNPVVVASDIPVKSKLVYELAKYLNLKVYLPPKRYPIELKNKTVKEFLQQRKLRLNAHERDALFAAIKAYRHYSSKIRNVERRLRSLGLKPSEEIISEIIKGKKLVEVLHERSLLRTMGRRDLD
jgi:predicted RNase H-like nuclease (RuvC/YqgF family)